MFPNVLAMSEEHDVAKRAKQLIDENRKRTLELYPPKSTTVQFLTRPKSTNIIDLGLSTHYSRGGFDVRATSARKRPRTTLHPEGDSVTGVENERKEQQTRNINGRASSERQSLPSKSITDRTGNDNNVEAKAATNETRAEQVKDGSDPSNLQPSPSLALVPSSGDKSTPSLALVRKSIGAVLAKDRPKWHPPWKLYRTISSHHGWVRSIAVDASNEWFATGSADRTIRIFDLATGKLRLTLTGHIATVRGLAISARHPYMFSVGEDKTVKCWDLEQNKVIRNYHGHLSGVYCCALHPTLDVLVTGGRDSTVRIWDMRTRHQIYVWGSHRDTVNSVLAQAEEPQVTSASADSTIRLWDLAGGKCRSILTNHKKGIRALVRHPRAYAFASAAADHIKTWGYPEGRFMRNLSGSETLVNALAVNEDEVVASGGDGGEMRFWDWKSGHCFQTQHTIVQPGSLQSEAGIFAMQYDHSGSRLICGEADKTIKMWKEDEEATPQTHPLKWQADLRARHY